MRAFCLKAGEDIRRKRNSHVYQLVCLGRTATTGRSRLLRGLLVGLCKNCFRCGWGVSDSHLNTVHGNKDRRHGDVQSKMFDPLPVARLVGYPLELDRCPFARVASAQLYPHKLVGGD